jgi:hypothetical protein
MRQMGDDTIMETVKVNRRSNATSGKLLFKSSWISLMKMWWLLLANGVATILVVYGTYLVVMHH